MESFFKFLSESADLINIFNSLHKNSDPINTFRILNDILQEADLYELGLAIHYIEAKNPSQAKKEVEKFVKNFQSNDVQISIDNSLTTKIKVVLLNPKLVGVSSDEPIELRYYEGNIYYFQNNKNNKINSHINNIDIISALLAQYIYNICEKVKQKRYVNNYDHLTNADKKVLWKEFIDNINNDENYRNSQECTDYLSKMLNTGRLNDKIVYNVASDIDFFIGTNNEILFRTVMIRSLNIENIILLMSSAIYEENDSFLELSCDALNSLGYQSSARIFRNSMQEEKFECRLYENRRDPDGEIIDTDHSDFRSDLTSLIRIIRDQLLHYSSSCSLENCQGWFISALTQDYRTGDYEDSSLHIKYQGSDLDSVSNYIINCLSFSRNNHL